MLEALDPGSTSPAKSFVASLTLSDDAMAQLDAAANVRRYLDRLLAAGLAGDALVIIARALPSWRWWQVFPANSMLPFIWIGRASAGWRNHHWGNCFRSPNIAALRPSG